MKIFDFIIERGGRAVMGEIEAPPSEWKSPLHAFKAALEHERKVTRMINDLMDLALEERDHASQIFLQWFVTEQVEEEASAGAVVDRLELAGEERGGLFMVDQELGRRPLPIPLPTQEE